VTSWDAQVRSRPHEKYHAFASFAKGHRLLRVRRECNTIAPTTGQRDNERRKRESMTQLDQVVLKSANTSGRVQPVNGSGDRRLSWPVRAKFALVRCLLWGWARLFSLKGLYILGQAFGTLEYVVNFKRRARYRQALGNVFPEGISKARERRITLDYFRRTRCDKLLYLVFDRLPRQKILHRIRFHGREYVDQALQRGHGAYLMISHNGSHHVFGLLLALLGYKVAGIRDRNEGAARIYIRQKLAETFPEIADSFRIYFADNFPRAIYRYFHDNCLVGSALDVSRVRDQSLRTCPVRIFGETREFLTGTLRIALRCDATIAQLFLVSRPNFYFRLMVHPPLHIPGGEEHADSPQHVAELMQRYANGIEAHVREYPDHLSRI
jgi:lauroyl/myristoyl acyltransferase